MSGSTKPRIAITGPSRDTESHLQAYLARLTEHDAEPVILRPGDEAQIADLLPTLQGLVLPGGADVDPSRYGQTPNAQAQVVTDPALDALEFTVLLEALERDLPVFGICRGFQALNVHFGGALIQDLPGHRLDSEGEDSAKHPIQIDRASRLGQLLGLGEAVVNSRHHQGVSIVELAPPLRPTAFSPDGLIEAFEHPDHRWVIGVQCHPEDKDEVPQAFSALFRDFMDAAKRVVGRTF
jgi:putative glutamine amidotransferase